MQPASSRLGFKPGHVFSLFVVVFLVVGSVGHDPWWKTGEGYSFGIVYHYYLSGDWLVPMNAGQPFMEKPPLYYWTAALLCKVLDGFLPLSDAARLTTTFYSLVSLLFMYKAARALFYGHPSRRVLSLLATMLFLGTYGVLQFAHVLLTDNAQLTGMTMALYGLCLLSTQREKWLKAGLWAGMGTGIAFMAKGVLLPGIIGLSVTMVWIIAADLKTKQTWKAALVATLAACPFLVVWPTLLYLHSPALFHEWFFENNIGRFFGSAVSKYGAENDRAHFIGVLVPFTFPVLPLACAELWLARRNWRSREYLIPGIVSAVVLFTLFVSASCRAPYFLPLVPPLCLLAAQYMLRLPVKTIARMHQALLWLFSLGLASVWIVWFCLRYPDLQPYFTWLLDRFSGSLLLSAAIRPQPYTIFLLPLAVLGMWVAIARRLRPTPLHCARLWLMGAMGVWITSYGMMMPWMNEKKSFRTQINEFTQFYNATPYHGDCLGNYLMGENLAPMFLYVTQNRIPLLPMDMNAKLCPGVLTFAQKDSPTDINPHWQMLWSDARFYDIKGVEMRYYVRTETIAHANPGRGSAIGQVLQP